MKSAIYCLISISCLVVCLICSCEHTKSVDYSLNAKIRMQVAKAMSLRLVSNDEMYSGALTQIFNDTIVGYNGYYFIQSLKNLQSIKKIYTSEIQRPNRIDQLKDGCLYFGDFSHSYMVHVSKDRSVKKYFEKTGIGMFYANKVYLVADKTVIISMDGIYVFRTDSEELLLNHQFEDDIELSWSTVIDKKLFFLENPGSKFNKLNGLINCLDLTTLSIRWKVFLKGEGVKGTAYDNIGHNGRELFIKASRRFLILDTSNGKINFENKEISYAAYDKGSDAYYCRVKNGVVCLNSGFQKIWGAIGCSYVGYYREYVVVKTLNDKFLVLIDKRNGKILSKIQITYPKSWPLDFQIIDQYVKMDGSNIYR